MNKSLAADRSRGVTTLIATKLEKDSYKHKFGEEESWQYSVAEIASPDPEDSGRYRNDYCNLLVLAADNSLSP